MVEYGLFHLILKYHTYRHRCLYQLKVVLKQSSDEEDECSWKQSLKVFINGQWLCCWEPSRVETSGWMNSIHWIPPTNNNNNNNNNKSNNNNCAAENQLDLKLLFKWILANNDNNSNNNNNNNTNNNNNNKNNNNNNNKNNNNSNNRSAENWELKLLFEWITQSW